MSSIRVKNSLTCSINVRNYIIIIIRVIPNIYMTSGGYMYFLGHFGTVNHQEPVPNTYRGVG